MSILGQLTDLFDGDDTPDDAKEQGGLVGMASELLGNAGGMSGLVGALQSGGLGDQVQSWLGSGANASVSAEQIQGALGDERIQGLAAKFGVNPETAATQLSAFLPGLMDKLSPGGAVPEDADVVKQVSGLLSGFLK